MKDEPKPASLQSKKSNKNLRSWLALDLNFKKATIKVPRAPNCSLFNCGVKLMDRPQEPHWNERRQNLKKKNTQHRYKQINLLTC
jgi:hypothetical protein